MNELLRRIKSVPELVDLAWAIGSSPLISKAPIASAYAFGHVWCQEQLASHEDFLLGLLQQPEHLIEYMHNSPSNLLGKRFERLLAYWFENSPQFEKVLENIQIFDGKTTWGEVDFLVKNLETDELWHIEAACKYYFGVKNSSHYSHWLGPNGKDSLEQKWQTLKNQLSIFESEQGRRLLQQFGLPKPKSILLLKGYFFQPFHLLGHYATPLYSHSQHNAGWYISEQEISALHGQINQWKVLQHPNWLGPSFALDSELMPGSELVDLVQARPLKQALLVAQVIEETEVSRGFILPKHLVR